MKPTYQFTRQDEARRYFRLNILPDVIASYSHTDRAAMDEAWGEWLDGLCKDGDIPQRGYLNWTRT